MLTSQNQTTDTSESPGVRAKWHNPQICRDFLSRLPLESSQSLFDPLHNFLTDIQTTPPESLDYLVILELARPAVYQFTKATQAQLIAPILPLSENDTVRFNRIIALWKTLGTAYSQCLSNLLSSGYESSDIKAQLLHRINMCNAQQLLVHMTSLQEPPPSLWQALYSIYLKAEKWQVHNERVFDPLNAERGPTKPASVISAPLLLHLTHPWGYNRAQLKLVSEWVERWASLAEIVVYSKHSTENRLVIDLATQAPAQTRQPQHNTDSLGLRELALNNFLKTAAEKLHQLTREADALRLQTTSTTDRDINLPSKTLQNCLERWRGVVPTRTSQRHRSVDQTRVIIGLERIYSQIAGELAPNTDRHQLVLRRRLSTAEYKTVGTQLDVDVIATHSIDFHTHWQLENISNSGIRIFSKQVTDSISTGWLVAISSMSMNRYRMCEIMWVNESPGEGVRMGLRLITGSAHPILVRRPDVDAKAASYLLRSAFMVANATNGKVENLILLPGTYTAEAPIELRSQKIHRVLRMKDLLINATGFQFCSVFEDMQTSPEEYGLLSLRDEPSSKK